jgi:IclR family transcriptional regulator, KDG regulon repressor
LPKTEYNIQSVEAAFAVINCFLQSSGRPLRSAEICASTGLSNNRIFRILSTLCKWEYLEKNPKTNEYSLGLASLVFGELYRNNRQLLREAAAPIIRELAEKSGDTSNLIVPYLGIYMAQIEAYQGKSLIQAKLGLGEIFPLVPYGIVSMFLMATMTEEEKTRLIAHFEIGSSEGKWSFDQEDLDNKIKAAVQQGYAVAEAKTEPGMMSVTAPIRDSAKKIVAAAALIVPKVRFTELEKQQKIHLVVDAAHQISNKLGYLEDSRVNYFG